MVPSGWKISNLEDVVSKTRKITYGIVVPGPEQPNGNLMIRAKDYSFGWQPIDTIYRVSDKIHNSYKRSKVRSGDILLTIVGSIGNTAVVPEWLDGANITQQTARLSFDEHCGDFFHLIMDSDIGKKEIYRYAKSGVQPSLNLSDIAKFKVPVPPLTEQQKIAKILTTWDKGINTTERLIENRKQQKKALMQQLLTGQKRLLDDSGQRFSGDWEVKEIDEVCNVGRGRVISKKEIADNEGIFPVYSSQTLNNGVMGYLATYDFDGEYATWTTDGVNAGTVSYREGKFNCTNVCGTLQSKDPTQLSIKFLALALSIESYKHVSHNLANPKLMNGIMKKIKIRIPALKEQKKISAVLTSADREIEVLEQQLADLQQEKKALMQQLLTGKKRVLVG